MPALLVTLGLASLAFSLHVVIWRIRVPTRQTRALALTFAGVGIAAGLVWGGNRHRIAEGGTEWRSESIGCIALGYAAIACAYLITYAGVEEFSPSLVIMRALRAAGDRGCTRDELATAVTAERFIAPRVRALVRDGLIQGPATARRLTAKGRRLARTSLLVARVFHLDGVA